MSDRPVKFSSSDASQCQHCGAHVSRDFRRVYGDQDDTVHRCPACDSMGRLYRGSAAGKEIDLPDPADQPNRNRGNRVDSRTDGGEWK
ncbi:hypothetical protein OB920_05325 [Halobacteria archaeon HArc-gm2]|nr:hypothetical protein [Halobacteria archaeon HArc-gm2]